MGLAMQNLGASRNKTDGLLASAQQEQKGVIEKVNILYGII